MTANSTIVPTKACWHMIREIDLLPLITDHAELACLCSDLEEVADGLPGLPDDAWSERLCEKLEAFVELHNRRENIVLTRLFPEAAADRLGSILLKQIQQAHLLDLLHAEDLAAVLLPDPDRHRPVASDTLAYMLRAFFDACRRAMALEELAILTLAGPRLTHEARAALLSSLASRIPLHSGCLSPELELALIKQDDGTRARNSDNTCRL